jgi:toxin ParE1/3/4
VAPLKLVWTRLALEDLGQAREFISAENPSVAPGVIKRIETAAKALEAFPQIGRPGRVEGTRELIVSGTPFILPYRVFRNRVEILAAIHAARRWPEGF